MAIECQICNKKFEKLITQTHLDTHLISTHEYKKLYGQDTLSTQEFRDGQARKGEKNSHYIDGRTLKKKGGKSLISKKQLKEMQPDYIHVATNR